MLSDLPPLLIQLPISSCGLLRRTSSVFRCRNDTMHTALESLFTNGEGKSTDALEAAAKRFYTRHMVAAIDTTPEHGILQTALISHALRVRCMMDEGHYCVFEALRAKSALLWHRQGRDALLHLINRWLGTAALMASVDPEAYEIKRTFFARVQLCLRTRRVLLDNGHVGI